jgi:hypothetical protein
VQIEAARAVIGAPRALDALRKAQSLAQEGLADVRRSVAALRASPTEDRPLPEALAALAAENRASGLLTELAVTGAPRPLPPQTELTLYRAMQEGLTNVRKHARASRVDIALDYGDNERVRLVVRQRVGRPDGRQGSTACWACASARISSAASPYPVCGGAGVYWRWSCRDKPADGKSQTAILRPICICRAIRHLLP